MSADGSQIKAGGVHFEIGANARQFKQAVTASEQEMKRFGDGISAAGTKAGNNFGQLLAKGLVGAVAIQSIDGALRELGDQIRRAKDSGGAIDAAAIGLAIGESIAKGLESIPIAGSLGKLLAEAFDSMSGGTMAEERVREIMLARIASAADAYREIGELTAKLAREQSLSGVAKEIADATDRLAPLVQRLKDAGQAQEAINEATAAYMRLVNDAAAAKVADAFDDALRTIDRMTGAVDAQAEKWRQVEEIAKRIEESYRAIGKGALAADAAATIRERFRYNEANASHLAKQEAARRAAAEAAAETARNAKSIADVVDQLEREAADIGKSGLERLSDQLLGMGADSGLVERALRAKAAIDQAAVGPISPKTYGTFSTFLASRLDQQFASEPLRKMEDKVGKIQRDLERLLRRITDNDGGLAFGA